MKHGAIDMGTNSIRLLIAELVDSKIVNSTKTLETVRIGQNTDKTGGISPKAIDRTIESLKKFKLLIEKEGLVSVPVIGTSAVRDAKNRHILIDKVKAQLDMDIEVIAGEREAELGFKGVLAGLNNVQGDIMVVDIGGGSTELIIGNKDGIKYMVSLDIGAVRMTEKFIENDKVYEEEINNIVKFIDTILEPELRKIKKFSVERVIGIGGTATTLAAIDQVMTTYDKDKIHNHSLKVDTIREILKKFISKGLEDRKKIKGLQPKRADIITAGTIILIRIMELLEAESISISEYDNLEGLVFEREKAGKR